MISKYSAAVSNLTAKQQANLLASQGLSQKQIKLAMSINNVSNEAIQEAMAQGRASWAKRESLTTDMLLNQQKNRTIAASLRAQAQTASEADKVKLLAIANQIAANSSEELTDAKLKELFVTQQLSEAAQKELMNKINNAVSGLGKSATKTGSALSKLGADMSALWATSKVGVILTIASTLLTLIPIASDIFDAFHKTNEELIQEANDIKDAYKTSTEEISSDLGTLRSLESEFAQLSKGVDDYGNNISLAADDYKRYQEIVQTILGISPELISGYDAEGDAIANKNGLLQQSIDLLEEEQRLRAQEFVSDENITGVGLGAVAELKEFQKENPLPYGDALSKFSSAFASAIRGQNDYDIFKAFGFDGYKWSDYSGGGSDSVYAQNFASDYYDQIVNALTTEREKFSQYFTQNEIDTMLDYADQYGKNVQTYNKKMEQYSKSLNPTLQIVPQSITAYDDLNDATKQFLTGYINSFSITADTTEEDITNMKNDILGLTEFLAGNTNLQDAFKELYSIDTSTTSLDNYLKNIKSKVQEIADNSDFTYDEVLQHTGYDDIIAKYETNAKNILDVLDDNIPKYYERYEAGTIAHFRTLEKYSAEVEILKDKIYSLSPDEITKAFDYIANYGIDTWEELEEALANKTFDVVLDYDKEQSGLESLRTAIEESISATGLSAESIDNIKARYQDLEGYDPARLFEETTNGVRLNTQALNELEQAYEKTNKEVLDNKLDGLVDQYNELTLEIEDCSDAAERAQLYSQRQNILDQINDTATLAARYEGLTSAYSKWEAAQSGGNDRDMYSGLISGKKEMDEEMSRGWIDDGTRAYLELLSGKDLSTAKYDEILAVYEELKQTIGNTKYDVFDFFTADSDGNETTDGIYNFLDTVKSVQADLGKEWVKIGDNGEYIINFGVDGDKAVAEALGISEELVQIILRAAEDAGFEVNFDSTYTNLADMKDAVEGVNDRLKELGATDYTFNINSTDLDDLDEQIGEAKEALANLKNEDGTLKVNVSEEDFENAQTLLATLIYQKQSLDTVAVLYVNVEDPDAGIETIISKLQEFKAAYNNLEVRAAIGADTTEAKKEVDAAIASLQGESPEIQAKLGIDLTGATYEEINAQINSITPTMMVECGLDATLIDQYAAEEKTTNATVIWDNNIDQVTAWMEKEHTANGTVDWSNNTENVKTHFTASGTINWSGNGVSVNGTAHASGSALSGGYWGAKKTETSLVGELGPEILVRNGRWTTVGENGAEFTQVKKGDIIFNHKQTEELLEYGYITGRGKASASGTAYSSGSGPGRYTITSASVNGSGSGSNDARDAAEDAAEEFREVFDWIAVRLEEINEDLDLKNAKLENTVGSKKQNTIVDDMIALNEKLYENLIAGANKYYSYAQTLLAKIPSEYRDAAQNGAIAIEEFVGEVDEETLEAIEEYREWVQKGADATQQAEETLTEISALAKQAFDNIVEDYDNKTSLRDSKIDQLEAYNALSETDLGAESVAIYQAMIKETNKNIATLEQQRNAMQEELDKRVASGEIKVNSQDWYDAVNEISAVDTKIIELTTDTEDYQDAINDLYWDNFDNLIDRLESVSDEADDLIDILANKDLVDESGNWTDEGITSLGLYAQKMEAAEVQAEKYKEEIDYLNKNWESLGYTEQEYIEKLDELKDGQYDAIKSYHDSKDAIVDMTEARIDAIKEGIEEEIEAYEELIEKKKEELDAEQDLHNFQKDVADQQKEISDIERQIAALSADNSASARSKRAKLQAELAEAQAALEETYYERSVEDQQNALDKELENFQTEKDQEIEGWEEYLENTNQVVSDGLATVQANTEIVYNTLSAMGEEYSLDMTEALISPWKEGEDAIQSFTERFKLNMSATVEELYGLAEEYDKIIKDIEGSGTESVSQVNQNASSYTQGEVQKEDKEYEEEASKVQAETIRVGGKINAGSAKIYEYAGDKSGENQYYSEDPIYKVLEIDGDWIRVRHHKLNTGSTGWFRKSQVKAYAKGAKSIDEDQLALIDELGEELQMVPDGNGRLAYLQKGTSVIPADLTENLMEWGAIDPTDMLERNRPVIGAPHITNNNTEINIDASVGELIHVEHLDGGNLSEITKLIDKTWEKKLKELNNQIRKFTR